MVGSFAFGSDDYRGHVAIWTRIIHDLELTISYVNIHPESMRAGSTVVEVKGSHAIYLSQHEAVAALVEQAAKSVKTSAAA
jgi:hypothetical protein